MGPAYHKGGPMSLGVPENPIDNRPKWGPCNKRKEGSKGASSKQAFFSRCVLGTVNLGIFCEDPGIHVKNLYGIHWGFPMFIVEEGGWKVEWEAGAGEKYP